MTRALLAAVLVLGSCGGSAQPTAASRATASAPETPAAERTLPPASHTTVASAPFLTLPLTDVRTGETFRLGDFRGKVTFVQAMAVW